MAELQRRRSESPSEPRFVVVKFDFAQLYDWLDALGEAGALIGASRWINEAENSIVVVGPAVVITSVRTVAQRLGINPDALQLIEGEMEYTPENHSLNSPADTTRGGYRVQNARQADEGSPGCTMGPWAQLAGSAAYVFLTASHCTYHDLSESDGGLFWQPVRGSTNARLIGYEYEDSPWRSCGFERCRYSDAAYILMQGTIPRARGVANPIGIGSILIEHTKPWTHIVRMSSNDDILPGDSVYLIGSYSGVRGGVVVDQCSDLQSSRVDTNGDVGTFRCMAIADYISQGGDSGAPIYGDSNAALFGIHAGVATSPSGTARRTFSKIQFIAEELGSVNACSKVLWNSQCVGWE